MGKKTKALSGASQDAYFRRVLKAHPNLPAEERDRLVQPPAPGNRPAAPAHACARQMPRRQPSPRRLRPAAGLPPLAAVRSVQPERDRRRSQIRPRSGACSARGHRKRGPSAPAGARAAPRRAGGIVVAGGIARGDRRRRRAAHRQSHGRRQLNRVASTPPSARCGNRAACGPAPGGVRRARWRAGAAARSSPAPGAKRCRMRGVQLAALGRNLGGDAA